MHICITCMGLSRSTWTPEVDGPRVQILQKDGVVLGPPLKYLDPFRSTCAPKVLIFDLHALTAFEKLCTISWSLAKCEDKNELLRGRSSLLY